MECYELLQAVEEGRKDKEVIDAVIDYIYDFDSSAYSDLGELYDGHGHYLPEGYKKYKKEALFRLTEGRKEFMRDLHWDVAEYYAQKDCDIPFCDDCESYAGWSQQDVIDLYRMER